MSTWLRPAQLFEFPAVQYIPLWVQTLGRWQNPAIAPFGPKLVPAHDQQQLVAILAQVGAGAPALSLDWRTALVAVAQNCEANECFYRAYKATLLGVPRPGVVQLFALPTDRIYKDWVKLALYDEAGQPLAEAFADVRGGAAASRTGTT